jgi:hypothetical protein
MVVALVQREAQLDVTPSSALFELPPFGSRRRYAVSGDGQRFLVGGRANPIENPPTLVINWSAGIAR